MLSFVKPSPKRGRNAITLLIATLSIAACGHPEVLPTIPILVHRLPPAELVTECPREPVPSAAFPDQKARFTWTLRALDAGRQCRAQSDRQGEWMTSPPP